MDSFFYLQFGIYKNQTLTPDATTGKILTDSLNACYDNEVQYKNIKYSQSTVIPKIK